MGIKRVKLNYKPVATRKTNEIAYVADLSERLYRKKQWTYKEINKIK